MSKGDRKAARMHEQRQREGQQQPYGSASATGTASNESEFVLYQWTGQGASDEFFKLNSQPQFKGLGDDAVLLPPHSLSISRTPQTGGNVIEAYPHGLAYADQVSLMGAVGAFGALFMAPIWIYGFVVIKKIGFTAFSLVMEAICAVFIYFLLRWDITGYRYAPVLFNRATGKVHVFSDQTKLFTWLPLWGGGKFEIQTFDWSCMRAQVKRFRVFTGNTAQELASLNCVVVKGSGNPDVVAEFGVGSTASSLAVQLLLDRWEHIRRFMEHEGPLFVEGDGPYVPPATQSLLGALCWGQPLIGPGRQPMSFGMVLAQLFTACFLWFTIPFGLVGWLCFHIKSKPKWPAEILASVGGNPLKGHDLEAWRGVVPSKPQASIQVHTEQLES